MKGVRFNKAMHPWPAGATAFLPDDQADRMIREGHAAAYAFPDQPHAADPSASVRRAPPQASEPPRAPQSYKTKRVA